MTQEFTATVGRLTGGALTFCLKHDSTRKMVNYLYNRLGYKSKSRFYFIYSKLYTDKPVAIDKAIWTVEFLGKKIKLPLNKKDLWLDWDTSVSILGHDIEIKQTYEYLIREKKVSCFFDIGTNYGTHSLLFLSQGIRTVSFEPNPNCVAVIEKLAKLNNLPAQIESCAVGDHNYTTELYFPEKETWLGTLAEANRDDLARDHSLVKTQTEVVTLDSYMQGKSFIPDFIKIDTEGFELSVLNGAAETIARHKPMILFEVNEGPDHKAKLHEIFAGAGYELYSLPYTASRKDKMSREDFLQSPHINFLALHPDKG